MLNFCGKMQHVQTVYTAVLLLQRDGVNGVRCREGHQDTFDSVVFYVTELIG